MATPAKTTNTAEATKVTADNFERAETDRWAKLYLKDTHTVGREKSQSFN